MYSFPYFKEKDQQTILAFMQQYPFALLTGCADGVPVATQIPVFIEERNGKLYLTGHIMRKSDHCTAFEKNPDVLCVFSGPHAYVSAAWYTHPQQASTWNYMSVHAKGRLHFLDEQGLITILRKTSLHFENNNVQSPTVFDNLPQEYTQRLLKAIAAFEIEVEEIDTVFKLSQNQDEENYKRIIENLHNGNADGQAIAKEMESRYEQVFHN